MKRSKSYRQAAEKIDRERLYSPAEAVTIAKSSQVTKFDPTVEVALRLGVDPRKQDQMVRGTVNLPTARARPPASWPSRPASGPRTPARRAPTSSAPTT